MDEEMHDIAAPSSSTARKRTADDVDDEDDDIHFETSTIDTASKRLRNPQGEAIERKTLRFNAHQLLSDLAFSRLYVTANYDRYSATKSPILLTVLSRHDALYRAVCQTLPALYDISPNLQALAIVPDSEARLDNPELIGPSDLRILPIVNTLSLEPATSDGLIAFLESLPQSTDVVILLHPTGDCLWTTTNLGAHTACQLSGALTQILQAIAPSDAMDQGV